jgi:peptidoglycan/xylan/chitin deacetylase (PgdA/CDA1 family)
VGEERRDESIADVIGIAGRKKWRVLAAKGAPAFLMLEGGVSGVPERPNRPNEEGAMLAAAAERIYRGLSAAERDAWPGGVALALLMLAERSFFPPTASSAGARREGEGIFRALSEGRYVRVVNFHATPREFSGGLEEQLSRLARSFAPVSYEDLRGLLVRGAWPHDRPGVVLNFFDGFRDNHQVAAPILDRLGLTGWFFLISGWISSHPQDQRAFADAHFIDLPYGDHGLPVDSRLALSPEEVRDLADRGHVIASHTRTHSAAPPDLAPNDLAAQAAGSRQELEEISGTDVRTIAWCEGVALGQNGLADVALRDAGYEILFANHAVQRVPVVNPG